MKFPKSNWYNIFQIVQMFFHFFQSGQIWSKSGQIWSKNDFTRFHQIWPDLFFVIFF